jgi:hypothetical protein
MQMATAACRDGSDQAVESGRYEASLICLLLLMAADTAFVAIHLVHKHSTLLANDLYSLSKDGGYAEVFQYVKIYWIVIMLFALWSRTRERVYPAWMLLYGYLLCDDALQIHERVGGAIARSWGYGDAFSLEAKDFGELTLSAAFGVAFLALISMTYLRSTHAARNASKDLALLFGILVFFGVGVDMLHTAVEVPYVKPLLGVLEDGGEMFAVSVVCWYVLKLLERRGAAAAWLWQTGLRVVSARQLKPG